MRRCFSRMHKEKVSWRARGLDPVFRDGLCLLVLLLLLLSLLLLLLLLFYLFLLAFYFRILILYTTDFNPKMNKDIIII